MHIFLSALDGIPYPPGYTARHDLGELLVMAFLAEPCGATSCVRAKDRAVRAFLPLQHAVPSHDTVSAVVRMIDVKAPDAAVGRVLAEVAALLCGDVTSIDAKGRRGTRDRGDRVRTHVTMSARASRLRLTLASVAAGRGAKLNALAAI